MLKKNINKSIGISYNVDDLKKYTIRGRIGEITFYGKELTKKDAIAKYEKKAERMDIFWKDCKETYYTNDIKLTDM